MDYTLIGLAFAVVGVWIGVWQIYTQNKTLTTIIETQYNSTQYLQNLAGFNMSHTKLAEHPDENFRVFSERMGIISRRMNKLMQQHKIEIPELISENGK